MGIKGLLQELHRGDVKAYTRIGFSKQEIFGSRPANTDTGTLISVCVLRHKQVYNEGGHPSVATTSKITEGG